MAQQVRASIELESGKKLTHYKSLRIEQFLFTHHRFEIVVPFQVLEKEDLNFFSKSHKDVCGQPITISFEPALTKKTFDLKFKGIITEISLSNQSDLSSVFIVRGYSPTILLEDSSMRRSFVNKSVQQIFDAVLTGYAGNVLKKQIKAKKKTPIKYAVQYNETNYEFLSRMAAEYGEWFFYNGKELLLGEPAAGKEVEFMIDGIQSFDMSIALMPAKFSMDVYDYTKSQTYKGKSSSQAVEGLNQFGKFALDESENLFSQEALLISGKPAYSQSELDESVKSLRSGLASNLVIFNGNGENPDISIGTVITVHGTNPKKGGRTGKEDFGKYRITEIVHMVDNSGAYSNSFKAVPETVKVPPVNPHIKQPVGEIELAKVIDNNDPDKLSRVKVEFNWPGDDKESDWLRVGTFYAGGADTKGMQFIPEKDVQVAIAYELNKPEYPFVLTSLYPKKDGMRAIVGSNEQKAIYTKAGNIIEFTDKQNENKIQITNSNKTDTSIELEFKGDGVISIKTNGKVEIEAQKTISLTAKDKITLKAKDIDIEASNGLNCKGKDVKVEAQSDAEVKAGMNIAVKGGMNAEMKGGTEVKISGLTSEVSGGTMLTLKGALVKIN